MHYELMGRLHAWMLALRREAGQGTVEYVGVVLVVAVVLAAVVTQMKGEDGGIGDSIVKKLNDAIKVPK